VPAGQTASYHGANGFLYQLSGMLEVASESDRATLREGEAMFLATAKGATLRALGSAPATLLHFLLLRGADLTPPAEGPPLLVTELYRSTEPISGLKPGPYEFTLTRVAFPPRMPSNPPHHRSGAALYYLTAGTGAITFTSEGRTEARSAGSIQYEPHDLLHQWGNPGDAPLVLLQANISPEGTPVVIFPK
jgi:quercetin dioxygenase-like cupin family protein